MSPPDTTKAKAPRRRWAGNLFHRIVDRSMLRRGKDFETRIAEFFKDGAHLKRFIKDFMSADVTEINPAFYRARTPQEMIDAPLEHQKRDKYNVLGGGYTSPWNKYKIIRTLGKGGFGKVYEVVDRKTMESYACKETCKVKLFETGAEQLLATEVQVMKHLSGSEGILQLYDVMEDGVNLYMILELCRGKDVLHSITSLKIDEGSTYSEAHAAALMHKMLEAVQQCHKKGVLHRDVKPENFLWTEVDGFGELKLADFGLSAMLDPKGGSCDEMCGTAPYMSPELWEKKPYTTEPDVWALGVTMAILLTGDLPFDGKAPEDLSHIVRTQELNLDAQPCELSQEARHLISRLLDKDPATRITVDEALDHPWVSQAGVAPTASLAEDVHIGVQKILHMNQLHKAILILLSKAVMRSKNYSDLLSEFQEHDKDGDGQLTLLEVKSSIGNTGHTMTQEQAEVLLESLDGNGAGVLSFEQYLVGEIHFRAQMGKYHMEDAFKLLDADGDGYISHDDLLKAMEEAEISVSPGIERAFKNLDLNSDAKISVEEFLNFWTHNVIEDDCHEDHHASAHRAADSAPRPRMLIRSESIELPMFGYASAL